MTQAYLVSTQPGAFFYHGHSYELSPIAYPDVDISNILLMEGLNLARAVCEENQGFITGISFDASRIPGFPRPLNMPLSDIPGGARLMLLRGGGIGDLIMLAPALKALRDACSPDVEILFSTFEDRQSLFEGLGYADKFYPHPIRLSEFIDDADYFVDFSDPKGIFSHVNMIDFHLDCLGIDPSTVSGREKIPRIAASLTRSKKITDSMDKICQGKGLCVLYSPGASDKIRRLPDYVLHLLATRHKDMIFLVPGKTPESFIGLKNVFSLDTSGGLSEFVTAIGQCDVLISSDSSAYHIAAALNKPSLVFFGSIPSRIRTTYYPNVIPLDAHYFGKTCVSPCGISALTETPPVMPIGANKVRDLKEGVNITTYSGESFIFDPQKGCPEANLTEETISPCLKSFTEEMIMEGFEKAIALIDISARAKKAGGI
ncbi:MAG: hypothetical protein J7L53_10440 [Deltaproteobacteria bacterium]|nr:hypothetical protein [Deltaproteobacteria bacterium]